MPDRPKTDQVLIQPGENFWLWLRSPRDGATAPEIEHTIGPVMRAALFDANPTEEIWELFKTNDEPPRWRIGYARPIEVIDIRHAPAFGGKPPIPPGVRLWDRHWYPDGPMALSEPTGARPWYVLVRFWWRGPPTRLLAPAFRTNWMNMIIRAPFNADWLLAEAWTPLAEARAPDPGEETWGDIQERRIKEGAVVFGKYAGGAVVVIGLGLLVYWIAAKQTKGSP